MNSSEPIARTAVLTGVRVGLVGEHSRWLTAIEEYLLAQGATVLRATFAPPDRPVAQHADVVVVDLASATHAGAQNGQSSREREYVESLAREQRVIGLLDEPALPPVAGLSDFVLPPFHPAEVTARLRRVLLEPSSPDVRCAGNLEVSVVNRTVVVGGRSLDVTFQEFELLRALLDANGRVLTRDDLARQLGHAERTAESRRMDVHVHRLRSKLVDLTGARIETVRNVGYRLTVTELALELALELVLGYWLPPRHVEFICPKHDDAMLL